MTITKFFGRIASAAFAAGIAYLMMGYALHPWEVEGPLSAVENGVAIAGAAVMFAAVYWRPARGTWGKEQSEDLLESVDE